MNLLPRNEHTLERIVRVVVGFAIVSLAFIGPQSPWAWLGLILIITGVVGTCPIYALFGVSTCSIRSKTKITN